MTMHHCHVAGVTQFGRKQFEDGYPITMLYFFSSPNADSCAEYERTPSYSPLEEKAVIFYGLITHAINFICGRSMSKSE